MSLNKVSLTPRWATTFGCLSLALLAGGASITVAAMNGWNHGSNTAQKVLWAVFGVVPVLGAQWLPALGRWTRGWLRLFGVAMWAACAVYAAYGHINFFVLAQQDAGDRRATSVEIVTSPSSRRSLPAVLADEASVRTQLTKIARTACPDCAWVRAKTSELQAKIATLEAEAAEARRDQATRDRLAELREARRDDLVIAKLAAWLGTGSEAFWLAPAVAFAILMDGLASLCWLLLAGRERVRAEHSGRQVATTKLPAPVVPVPVTTFPVTLGAASVSHVTYRLPATPVTPVTPSSECQGPVAKRVRDSSPRPKTQDLERHVQSVREAMKSGALEKPTVKLIREYLECSQQTASAVRAALNEKKPALSGT